MASYNSPRRGSMAFYPRVRAKKQTPTMKAKSDEAKALSFLGYKVGMTQILGKDEHKGSITFGSEVSMPATVVEVPEMKVLGIRAYMKNDIGTVVYGDVLADTFEKEIERKIVNFKKKSEKNKNKETKKKNRTIADFEKDIENISYFTLLVNTTPKSIGLKKKPELVEVNIGGKKEEQLNYAKEKIGKSIEINEVLEEGSFLDVKGVTKGKGIQGVIKRFNVRIQRPKAKTRRIVGSISPWNPSTVMYTVARPGQMGYHNRTEYNKRLLKISDNPDEVNGNGFSKYGKVKGKYIIIKGSIPGPAKRCVALRKGTRPEKKSGARIGEITEILKK
jgi:large subunit ribosomal protein L3